MSSATSSGKCSAPARSRMVVFGWAPEATIGARISSPSASVTPIARPSRTSIEATGGAGADLGARRLGRARDRLADRAHAADHLAPSARDSVDLAERVVEQVVGGARRARPGPDADHAGRGDRALEPVVLEPVVEQVGDRHREDADQVVDVAAAEAGRPRALAKQREQVGGVAGPERRRLAQHHRPQERRRRGRAGPRSPRRPRRRAWRTSRSRRRSGPAR